MQPLLRYLLKIMNSAGASGLVSKVEFLQRSLWLKIMNSAGASGLLYGFVRIFVIGPSYYFVLRVLVMEEDTETQKSAIIGFLTGQLIMFMSIFNFNEPLRLVLINPHTQITLILTYLFFNFVDKNNKHYYSDDRNDLDSGYNNLSIRNFRIIKVFLNNVFFQLVNPLLFPSSRLIGFVNGHFYLYQFDNQGMVFLMGWSVGWFIGHSYCMKLIEWILLCRSRNRNSIRIVYVVLYLYYITVLILLIID